jgi:N6-adenosine-specific RNA methylase IME4
MQFHIIDSPTEISSNVIDLFHLNVGYNHCRENTGSQDDALALPISPLTDVALFLWAISYHFKALKAMRHAVIRYRDMLAQPGR